MGKALRTPEAEHYLCTGKISLLYPAVEVPPAKLPAGKVIDLHPSPAGRSDVSAKRAALLGRPVDRQEIETVEGMIEEDIARDESGRTGFGQKVLWVVDGVAYVGPEGLGRRAFPDEMEREQRRRAGMIVGDTPQSVVRIPLGPR